MNDVEKINSFGKNFLLSFGITLIIGIVNYAFPILIGLLYGPKILGDFSILFYYSTLISIPIANGVAPAISRYIAASFNSDTNQTQKFENIGSKLSADYLIIVVTIFSLLGFFLFNLNAYDIIIILILISFNVFHHIFRKSLQGQEKFQLLLKLEIVSFCVFVLFMAAFCILPYSLNWGYTNILYLLFLPVLMFHLAFNLINFISKIKLLNFKTFLKFPKITIKILRYAFLVGLGSIFGLGISQIQIIISDRFLNELELGVLSFWNSAMAPILLLSVTVTSILVPRLTRLLETKTNLVNPFVNKLNFSISLIIYPIVGLIYLLIEFYPNILDYLTLYKFQMEIYWLVPILLSFQVVSNLLSSITISYFSSSEKRIIFNPITSFLYSCSIIISWILLVPKYGILGFAGGMAIGGFFINFTLNIIALIITKGKIGLHIFVLIILNSVNVLCLIIYPLSSMKFGVIIWSIITVISLVIGSFITIKILKDKEYSYKNTNQIKDYLERDIEDKDSFSQTTQNGK